MKKIMFVLVGLILISFGPTAKNKTPKSFVFIPSCSTTISNKDVSVQAFYMAEKEVSNFEYRQFLNHLKKEKNDSLLAIAIPDTTKWELPGMQNSPMVNLYFWHPAYDNYPVVNVTKAGADLYCQWLTKELRTKYGEHLNDVRLPTKYEWVAAAQGGDKTATYAWGGAYLQNTKGCYLANFKVIGEHNIRSTNKEIEIVSDSTFIPDLDLINNPYFTATTESYTPNTFGLYNMCGNVAELTADGEAYGGHWNATGYDIRIKSHIKADTPSPYVGFRPIMSYTALKK
ncbi:MAG: SUMF1/EgtB/PvdO family nonheme iron enzyme [Crocinitomix sp.]|nr:SUMF1/EgtB/PvdO family nonheme iron enzyme [Crocinitomix sp.]